MVVLDALGCVYVNSVDLRFIFAFYDLFDLLVYCCVVWYGLLFGSW